MKPWLGLCFRVAGLGCALAWGTRGFAQTGAFPIESEAAPGQPMPPAIPPPAATPSAAPPPSTGPTPQVPATPAPSPAPPPSPSAATAPAPPMTNAPRPSEPPPIVEPPPPPPKPQSKPRPLVSLRADPLSWLFEGRLGIELETQLYEFLSFELVPVFVTSEVPPSLRLSYDVDVHQKSNGLGALAGTSLGLGFWVGGKPMRGTVLRAIFTNYSYTYFSEWSGPLGQPTRDEVSHVERHLYAYLGSQNLYGIFTVAGGIGLGVELNKERRCFDSNGGHTSNCNKDQQLIRVGPETVHDLHSFSYPLELMARISLGVTF